MGCLIWKTVGNVISQQLFRPAPASSGIRPTVVCKVPTSTPIRPSGQAGPRPVRGVPAETFVRYDSSSRRANVCPTLPAAFRQGSRSIQRSCARNRPRQVHDRASGFLRTGCGSKSNSVPDVTGLCVGDLVGIATVGSLAVNHSNEEAKEIWACAANSSSA